MSFERVAKLVSSKSLAIELCLQVCGCPCSSERPLSLMLRKGTVYMLSRVPSSITVDILNYCCGLGPLIKLLVELKLILRARRLFMNTTMLNLHQRIVWRTLVYTPTATFAACARGMLRLQWHLLVEVILGHARGESCRWGCRILPTNLVNHRDVLEYMSHRGQR